MRCVPSLRTPFLILLFLLQEEGILLPKVVDAFQQQLLPRSISISSSSLRRRLHRHLKSRDDDDDNQGIQIIDGRFDPIKQLTNHWGREPILIRNAFDATTLMETNVWPNWDDMISWSCYPENEYEDDEDDEESVDVDVEAIMSRLIVQKDPNRLDSFDLELGPFPSNYIQQKIDDDNVHTASSGCWTLLVNDVERIHPPLNDWIHQEFALWLPSWRIDDGQISIAPKGGGIGPHVDNYDVFLVQASGQRQWVLGEQQLSVQDEMDTLIDDLNVRILDLSKLTTSNQEDDNTEEDVQLLQLNAGDVLYLPPRVVHWGTSLSNNCMTLSVGCRTPSATELVSKIAEQLSYSTAETAVKRYTDPNLLSRQQQKAPEEESSNGGSCESLTSQIKEDMKRLVRDAINDILDDDGRWDEIVGKLITEPKRPIETYSRYEDRDDDDDDESSLPSDHVHSALVDGIGTLWPAEGVSFATSSLLVEEVGEEEDKKTANLCCCYRVFADGQMMEWKIPTTTSNDDDDNDNSIQQNHHVLLSQKILTTIKGCLPLTKESLSSSVHENNGEAAAPWEEDIVIPAQAMLALEDLLRGGYYYYYYDEEDDDEGDGEGG